MSERYFRIIIGLWLVVGLLLDSATTIFALVCVLLFEGITNLRVPIIVSRLRYGKQAESSVSTNPAARFSFEAERALRLIVVIFVAVPLLQSLSAVVPSMSSAMVNLQPGFLDMLWWLPWFVGFALIGAGLSGMCPMVMTLKHLGLK